MTAASRAPETPRPAPARVGRVATCAVLIVSAAGGALVGFRSGFGLLWFVPYAAVGSLLVLRRKGGAIGWLLLALAWAHVLAAAPVDATPAQIAAGSAAPGEVLLAIVSGGPAGPGLFLLYLALSIVFPSGRLPAGTWRKPIGGALAVGALLVVATAFATTITLNWSGAANGQPIPNPIAVAAGSPVSDLAASAAVSGAFAIFMLAGAVSLLVRFRRAMGVERQQLRWVVAALGFVMVAVLGGFVVGTVVQAIRDSGLQWLPAIIAFPCVPVAIGVAILRYRLYDIDRIVSRTVSWAVVTATLASIFVGLVVGLQALLAPLTSGSSLAVAASTLVVFALFSPLRRRVQRLVDRRFDRARYDAERTITALTVRLRDETDVERVETEIETAVQRALAPSFVGVWTRDR